MQSQIVPISFERHGAKFFRRFSSYAFAANETVAPLVGAELGKATTSFPIAFLVQEGGAIPVAVMGIEPGENLFVGTDGRWMGSYIPAAFRAHPFVLAQTQDHRQVLCINEASGLVVDDQSGEPFFDADKAPSGPVVKILDFLTKIHENRLLTDRACQTIFRLDLLEPWTITAPGDNGPRNVTGLWRISEGKMSLLKDEVFLELRHTGALALAYAQLMSMGHLSLLERLFSLRLQARQQARPPGPLPDTLDSIFGAPGSSEELQIDWSKFQS